MAIKSRRMGWVGHVARIGMMRNAYRIWGGKPTCKRPLGRLVEDERIILELILKK
jgi:hypothetical protein